MPARRLAFALVWTSFYEQLAWTPLLVPIAVAAGDAGSVALAASAYSLANFFGNLVLGALGDRVGRLRVGALGLLAMAATALLHLVVASPGAVVLVRFLHGAVAGAVAPAALAVISAGSPAGGQSQSFARVGLVIALASMLAPVLTGRLAGLLGIGTAVGILAGFLLLTGAVALLTAQRPAAAPARQPAAGGEGFNLPLALYAALAAVALMVGQNILFYAFPLQTHRLGMGPAATGGLLSAFAVGALIAFVRPLSAAADRWGRRLPLLTGLVICATGQIGLAGATAPAWMAAGLLVYGLGFGLVFIAVSTLAADAAGRARRGAAFGILGAAFSAGAVAGPLLATAFSRLAQPFTVAATAALVCALAGVLWRPAAPALPPAASPSC